MGQEDYLNSLLNSVAATKDDQTKLSDENTDQQSMQDSGYNMYFEQSEEELGESEGKNEEYVAMGLEEYLKNDIKQNLDTAETEETSKGDAFEESGEESIDDLLADSEEESKGDVFVSAEEEPIGEVFVSAEEEPIGEVFTNAEEESIGDVFTSTEEEPIGDVFTSAEEEPIGEVFTNAEEEPIGDVSTSTEEEPIGDIFASTEEEPIGDVFISTEEEPIGDIFASTEEDPIGDIFADSEEEPITDTFAETEEQAESKNESNLLNNIDNILNGVEGLNFEEEEKQTASNDEINMADLDMNSKDEMLEKNELSSETFQNNSEEDIFNTLSSEEPLSLDSLDNTDDTPESQSLFDDDLMKLLGEEDLSSEDIFGGIEEDELPVGINNKEKASDNTTGIGNEKAKKEGLFAKLFKGKNANKKTSNENDEILEELSKKDKKKKSKKGKPKKEKKAKNEKKLKKEKAPNPEIIAEPSPPLHKGQVISVFVLCVSIGVLIMIGVNLIPYSLNMNTARRYYEREEYVKAYNELEGLALKEKDKSFYNKLQTLMLLNNQLNTYKTYDSLGLKPEALSSLLKGVAKYDAYYAVAQQYDIAANYDSMLEQITGELNTKYAVSIEMARNINTLETKEEYSAQIYNITK